MASHVPKSSHRPIEGVMNDLKVDPLAKITSSSTSTVSAKERNQSDTRSRMSSSEDYESLETYQGLPCPYGGYYGFYYPGLEGSVGETKDQGYYSYGTEYQYPVTQGENGSLIYLMPGNIQPYDASNTHLPLSPVDGANAQYASQPMFAAYPNPYGYGDITPQTYLWDPSYHVGDGFYGDTYGYGAVANPPSFRQNTSSSSHNRGHHSKANKTTFPSVNSLQAHEQLKTPTKGQGKGYFPFSAYPLYNQERGGMYDKAKTRNRVVNGSSVGSFSDEQDQVANEKSNSIDSVIRRDQYNLHDFQTKYDHAFFFVIKSYSEDDVHKSIKYNVWSSTLNGNKKLDSAYQEAQDKVAKEGIKCPVFLFFSVNASGQFCGVAEMTGRVNFEKSMEFWQQDKWTGYFPVKWHLIKDVPNPQLRHVILENNENKPVTNSRDTQEVRLPQGNEVLSTFKNYAVKTSILDDFDFYENREKLMHQKKLRAPLHNLTHMKMTESLVGGLKAMDISTESVDVEEEEGDKDRSDGKN